MQTRHTISAQFKTVGLAGVRAAFERANQSGAFALTADTKVKTFAKYGTVQIRVETEEYRNAMIAAGAEIVDYEYHIVQITGTVEGIPGFEIIGKIDDAEGVRQIFNFSDADVSEHRERQLYCAHCNTNHKRVSTILVRNIETNEVIQVGNSCIEYFTGTKHDITKELRRIFGIAETFNIDPESDETFSGAKKLYAVKELVMIALAVNAKCFNGHYAKSVDGVGTKFGVIACLNKSPETVIGMTKNEIVTTYGEQAETIINQFSTIELNSETSDFIFNLVQIAGAEYIPFNRVGIACALTYKSAPRSVRQGMGFYGAIGQNYKNIEIDITECKPFVGYYGPGYVVTAFIGENKITIFTTKEYQPGTKTVSLTVKEHKNDPRFGESTIAKITSRK